MSRMAIGMLRSLKSLIADRSGIAATEFAVIMPVMLVMFFGTVEFSTGLAIDRKVTLIARTLSDLTSQSSTATNGQIYSTIDDPGLTNIFTAAIAILTPYPAVPVKVTLSEIYVDTNNVTKIQWSKSAVVGTGATQATLAASLHNVGDIIAVPPQLLVKQTYMIFSEVSYLYVPSVGYVMGKSGITMTDSSYTRPRQVACVRYNNLPALDPSGHCPTP
jgi:Flp pilus assembly protein TadG